uniref:Uncharacterized protein n=1 Tax=Sulfolobus neozealandicus TaxID=299422 RepID=Q5DVE9_9CREN|nr:hypothetical protein [Sulfolobus neozealandicus]
MNSSRRITKEDVREIAKKSLPKKLDEKGRELYKCPRCSEFARYIDVDERDGHFYIYAIHYNGTRGHGKPKLERHYLGALEYDYVERFNNINLQGLFNEKRHVEYIKNAANQIDSDRLTAYDFAETLDSLSKNLKSMIIDENDKKILEEKMKKIFQLLEKKDH